MEIVEGLYIVAEGSLSSSTNQLQSHTSLLHLTYYREFLCFESYHSSTKEPNIRHGKLIILSLDYCRTLQTTASELLYMDLYSTIIDLLMDNHKKKLDFVIEGWWRPKKKMRLRIWVSVTYINQSSGGPTDR